MFRPVLSLMVRAWNPRNHNVRKRSFAFDMTNLPSIVVVDSSKEPEEQKRTQITIYKPANHVVVPNAGASNNSKTAFKKGPSSRVQRRLGVSRSKISSVTALSHSSKHEAGSATSKSHSKSHQQSTKVPTNRGSSTDSPKVSGRSARSVLVKKSSRSNLLSKNKSDFKNLQEAVIVEDPVVIGSDVVECHPDGIEVVVRTDEPAPVFISPFRSDEDRELDRIKAQITRNLRPKNTPEDKAKAADVVKQLETRIASRRPTKLESKWFLWKYTDDVDKPMAWMEHHENPTDVGWGRRIYDKQEIESDDRERERMALNDDTMRNLNMKMKEVPERYGLWDDIYDKRVIRALDCNLQWKPNRKEEERRKKVQQKRMKERMRRKNQNKVDGDDQGNEENYQPFQDSKDKWFATGQELTDDDMSFIMQHTNFTEAAVRKWFKNFREECPGGKLTKEHLHMLFKRIFPVGDSEVFCNHIFRIFDSDNNGFLDFKEFLMALDVSTCRSEREKLEWAFRLYDVDASGSINLKEIITIMETLDEVEGGYKGSAQVAVRAKEIFDRLDSDKDGELTMDEFVEGYLRMNEEDRLAEDTGKKLRRLLLK